MINHILPLAMGVVLTLAGCGTYVPNTQENPWASAPDLLVEAILRSIRCEIQNSVVYVINADWKNFQDPRAHNQGLAAYWLYNGWGAQVQVTLKTDEQSALSPSGSYMPNIFTLLGGANISSDATRTDIVNYYYTVKDLYGPEPYGSGKPCTQDYLDNVADHPVGSLLIQSDLKLREWLSALVLGSATNVMPISVPANSKNSANAKNAISHEVQFQVVTGGTITPTWKLALATINPTVPFASASRTRTHDLLITLGPNDPTTNNNLYPNSVAASSFQAQQIGIASGSSSNLRNSVISNSIISNIAR